MTDLFEDNVDNVIEDDTKPLIGEQGIYKTNEAAEQAIREKDRFIAQLQTENKGSREDLLRLETEITGLKRMEDYVRELTSAQRNAREETNNQQSYQQQAPVYNPEELKQTIRQEVVNSQSELKRQANLQEVEKTCREKLGPNYSAKLNQQAQALGMPKQQLNALAADNPQAFYRLMNLEAARPMTPDFNIPNTSVNSSAMGMRNQGQKTDEYYENLRRDKPSEFWSPRVYNEYMNREIAKAQTVGLEKYLASNQ